MAIGTSGNQFKNAPVVGHLMAELIDKVEHGHDHDNDPVKVKARLHRARARRGLLLAAARDQPDSSFSVNGWRGVGRSHPLGDFAAGAARGESRQVTECEEER